MIDRRSRRASTDASVEASTIRKLRCAVYTRKSSEEGLDMAFNSLDAQREACEAYITSQKSEGWVLVPDRYDDGGISGGTIERPELKRLLADIRRGLVDVVVAYKTDRLSRSMLDFLKLVELFDASNVTFISVTEAFNNTTSVGRLTLNMLLSFAQFEREVIGERIRDKHAASRKRGIWMGGWAPLGYIVRDRKLIIDEPNPTRVRAIFRRFVQLKSATAMARELVAAGERNRYGQLLDKGVIYRILNNRVYVGDAVHKGTAYPGEHEAIIDRKLWDQVHKILKVSPRTRANTARAQTPALLKGLLFGPDGAAMSPSHTRKSSGRLYRYYVSQTAMKQGHTDCPMRMVPAGEIEQIVLDQIEIASQLGLMNAITIAVLRHISQSIDALNSRFGSDVSISMNISAEQAGNVEFMQEFIDDLKQFSFATRFIIEVTEDVFVATGALQASVLPMIKEAGAKLSIDDFGTGYSSLSSLSEVTADEVKIDRSFITCIQDKPRNQGILQAMQTLCKALDLKIVVEGVETQAELDFIRQNTTIEVAQGYYFSRPIDLHIESMTSAPRKFFKERQNRSREAARRWR